MKQAYFAVLAKERTKRSAHDLISQAMARGQTLDPALIKACFEMGLMGIQSPEAHGGSGGSVMMVTLAVEEISKIDAALRRIETGDYGYCDETGEPIGVGRLLARPTANLSLEAQQRRELKQKMFGD